MGDRKIVEQERRRCDVIDVTVDEFEEVNSVKEELTLVMGRFGSEPWSEPEPDRTEP